LSLSLKPQDKDHSHIAVTGTAKQKIQLKLTKFIMSVSPQKLILVFYSRRSDNQRFSILKKNR